MVPGVERQDMPDWLRDLPDNGNFSNTFSIAQILKNSLFYPASEMDGKPVKYLAGMVHSFVYVDYGIDRKEVLESLHGEQHGFLGYSVLGWREVSERELAPNGWETLRPLPNDGNPLKYLEYIKEPFAIWSVYKRDDGRGESHGPDRFSLLYICQDGVVAFRTLYHGNHCSPSVMAIIQPGTGFGQNWTDFSDPEKILGRSVLQNPHGTPKYLLYGGIETDYRPCCWPNYSECRH